MAWVSVDSGLPGAQTPTTLFSFPLAMITSPDKINFRKRVYLALSSRSSRELVRLSLLYSVQGPRKGMAPPTVGGPSLLNYNDQDNPAQTPRGPPHR